jgi:ABC-type transport system substrate-binding protein
MSVPMIPSVVFRPLRLGLAKVLLCSLALASGLALARPATAPAASGAADGQKVLRYAFLVAETGFDPAKVSDLYSHIVTGHIFEGLYVYDYLARPALIKPLTAAALPETSADFRIFTIQVRPGIYFADDPAFGGKKRELVAEDYVYSLKRFADPANKSPIWSDLEELNFVGLNEAREKALKDKKPFDYNRELPGLRALDRYTLRIELKESRPRLIESLAVGSTLGAVAREVMEAYKEDTNAHPVGTGPFKLAKWRRSSLIVLDRNPDYRERYYDAQPAADDVEGQALLARFKGRRIPMLDRVEVSIIDENQPRWLSFLNAQQDLIYRVPEELSTVAMPGGKVAPGLARHGVKGYRILNADYMLTFFNMEDPVVGGYTPEKVALRRAIGLGMDCQTEIDRVFRGQAIRAQAMHSPNTSGYHAEFKSEMGDYDPARARALLDLYGYVDRDGDGWREQPDGSALVLIKATTPDQQQRSRDDIWQRNMTALGLKVDLRAAKWPENLKSAQAGKLMIWNLASSATQFDGQPSLQRMYGPASGGANLSRFKNTEFDAIYDKMLTMPDGPEREALFTQAKRIGIAYAPYKIHGHRFISDMAQPWVVGYRRTPFNSEWWQFIDIDNRLRK